MKKYIAFTVFASGMTSLAAEFGASRLLQMRFGNINIVWAVIIGLILVYFSIGYSIGGRRADRDPRPEALFTVLAWGGLTLGFVPVVAQPVLLAAASAFDMLNLGVLALAFGVTLILFSLPVILLAMASPFAIRISLDDAQRAGNVAGNLYAVSTIGSVLGAFLPTLVLFPLIGTSRTILLFGVLILVVSIIGLFMSRANRKGIFFAAGAAALILLSLFGDFHVKNSEGQVYETESAYNYIEVIRSNGATLLRLNDGQGVHSIYTPDIRFYNGPWELFLAGPYFYADANPADVKRIGIVGLAAGTAARQATAIHGPIPIDGWEIDPAIVQVGREYFGMTMPNLNVYIEDGRWGLEHSPHQYDIIAVDAYRPPYIPPHMTTREFFQAAASHLTPRGALVINVGRAPNDRVLINGLATTLASVFPSIHVMDIPGSLNSMIYATMQETSRANFEANLRRFTGDPDVHPLLLQTMTSALIHMQPGYETSVVFTDDLAPIEWLTNNLVISFFLHGDMEGLK
ncbi:MAG: Polyamine aminopropyltransferase [Anaerolineales bacterium]|nr:Polyamine aminopropyltransferase [Anaerolineales bacterium]